MPLYIVTRAHRGRYGFVRTGVPLTLPENYAKELMRHKAPLVRLATPEESQAYDAGAVGAGAPGELKAGPATAVPPAAGKAAPLSSQQVGRRSRKKT